MPAINLKTANFDATVNGPGLVLIDFWAPWCAPCRAFAPIFEKASERHPTVKFTKVNVDEEPPLAQAFGVQSIPTLFAFRDGVPLFEQPGVLPDKALDTLIAELQGLDMDEVRRKLKVLENTEAAATSS